MRVRQDGTLLCSCITLPAEEPPALHPEMLQGGVSSLSTALLGNHVHHAASTPRFSHQTDLQKSSASVTCQKILEKFVKWESLEAHHLSNHAGILFVKILFHGFDCDSLPYRVSELVEGDSSRMIPEIICRRTGWSKTERSWGAEAPSTRKNLLLASRGTGNWSEQKPANSRRSTSDAWPPETNY
ncbi:hypothetical protein B296_00050117 [Ensete ventricosum]|uniref:Uncharacterized protein n=1 Tax=Ensete ventricosum TaxID=4639 RepID=A0A426XGL4_ENSVE|nr:hypothetical protein B296_00050117 [Ensete ventricosum]